METRNFTLRIGDAENAALQQIKKMTLESTDSGAIKHVIRSYAELNKRYEIEIRKNKTLVEENSKIKKKVNCFLDALGDLGK